MIDELYMNKKNRDKRVKELQSDGYNVSRGTVRNQQLHPEYVKDYELETGIKLTNEDKGFGNSLYKTYFRVLYRVLVSRESQYEKEEMF